MRSNSKPVSLAKAARQQRRQTHSDHLLLRLLLRSVRQVNGRLPTGRRTVRKFMRVEHLTLVTRYSSDGQWLRSTAIIFSNEASYVGLLIEDKAKRLHVMMHEMQPYIAGRQKTEARRVRIHMPTSAVLRCLR